MSNRLHKVDPNAFEEFQKMKRGYMAEMSSINDLKPFAPKTAGKGISPVDSLQDKVANKHLISGLCSKYGIEAEAQYKLGKKIDRKLLVKVSNIKEEKTQDLGISC